jgi:hypothetical protein
MIDARRLWLAVLVQAINDLAHTDLRGYSRREFNTSAEFGSSPIPVIRVH